MRTATIFLVVLCALILVAKSPKEDPVPAPITAPAPDPAPKTAVRTYLLPYDTIFAELDQHKGERLCAGLFAIQPGEWVRFREMVVVEDGQSPAMPPPEEIAWSDFRFTIDDDPDLLPRRDADNLFHLSSDDVASGKECLPRSP